MTIAPRPQFAIAHWEFTCSECLREFNAGAKMMLWSERLAPGPLPSGYGVRALEPKKLCEDCGKLLLECL